MSKPRASLFQLHPALLCQLPVTTHWRRQKSVLSSQSHSATFLPVQPLPQSQPEEIMEILVRNVLSRSNASGRGPISAPNQNGWEWRGAKPGLWAKWPCLSALKTGCWSTRNSDKLSVLQRCKPWWLIWDLIIFDAHVTVTWESTWLLHPLSQSAGACGNGPSRSGDLHIVFQIDYIIVTGTNMSKYCVTLRQRATNPGVCVCVENGVYPIYGNRELVINHHIFMGILIFKSK